MTFYKTKARKLSGTSYGEVKRNALYYYQQLIKGIRRKPYIRSAYFNKEKIFFDYFWSHLWQKPPKERLRRLRYLPAAVELIKKSRNRPIEMVNPNKKSEILFRFQGVTREGEKFYVQIKEEKKGGKYFMSCFPAKQTKQKIPRR